MNLQFGDIVRLDDGQYVYIEPSNEGNTRSFTGGLITGQGIKIVNSCVLPEGDIEPIGKLELEEITKGVELESNNSSHLLIFNETIRHIKQERT